MLMLVSHPSITLPAETYSVTQSQALNTDSQIPSMLPILQNQPEAIANSILITID